MRDFGVIFAFVSTGHWALGVKSVHDVAAHV
jgi:hypothetical protein